MRQEVLNDIQKMLRRKLEFRTTLNELRYRSSVKGKGRNYRNGGPGSGKSLLHQYPIGGRTMSWRLHFMKEIPVYGIGRFFWARRFFQAIKVAGNADYVSQKRDRVLRGW